MSDCEVPKKKTLSKRGSKNKGSNFERELACYLNQKLFPTSNPPQIFRTPLSGSFSPVKGVGGADLTGTPDLWVEAKRTETLSPHKFMAQARKGATAHGSVDMPIVITRRNLQTMDEALCIMTLKDFTEMYRYWLMHRGHRVAQPQLIELETANVTAL